MVEHNSNLNKKVVLLFPWRSLGEALISRYLEKNYEIFLFTLSGEMHEVDMTLPDDKNHLLNFIEVDEQIDLFWKKLSDDLKEKMRKSDIILNFTGRDFLNMNVEGQGTDWKINPADPNQQHFAFIDNLLKELSGISRCVWINLVYGRAGQTHKHDIHCQTRYGIMGLTNLIKLNPSLAGIEVVNICLTYLKHRATRSRVKHCSHCVTEKYEDELVNVRTTEDIAEFLIRRSESILSLST